MEKLENNLIKRSSQVGKKRDIISFNGEEHGDLTYKEIFNQIIEKIRKRKDSYDSNTNSLNVSFPLECILNMSNDKEEMIIKKPIEPLSPNYFKTQENIHPFFKLKGEKDFDDYFPHSPNLINKENTPSELNIQKFLKRENNVIITKDQVDENKNVEVLIFSPHQDDEVLGAATLIHKLCQEKIGFRVIYMTSGKGGGDSNTRQKEAIEGIKVLGGSDKNCLFFDFPFYTKDPREVSKEDYLYLKTIIGQFTPKMIFICADVFDPHASHRRCYDIIIHYLHTYSNNDLNNDNDNSDIYNPKDSGDKIIKENINMKNWDFKVFFYFSVWYWPKENEVTHVLFYDFQVYKQKICAMMEHTSQIKNKCMGPDDRPFYERATHRDKWFGKKYLGKLGEINEEKVHCEIFYMLNK